MTRKKPKLVDKGPVQQLNSEIPLSTMAAGDVKFDLTGLDMKSKNLLAKMLKVHELPSMAGSDALSKIGNLPNFAGVSGAAQKSNWETFLSSMAPSIPIDVLSSDPHKPDRLFKKTLKPLKSDTTELQGVRCLVQTAMTDMTKEESIQFGQAITTQKGGWTLAEFNPEIKKGHRAVPMPINQSSF